MRFAKSKLLNITAFKYALEQDKPAIPLYKNAIKGAIEQLNVHQHHGISSAELVEKYTWMIDQLLLIAWQQHTQDAEQQLQAELVAVGGYGRGELHPYSDVDLLILLPNNNYEAAQSFLETFLTFLWDIGLEIGHSVRSPKDCIKEARGDITIMTNLLEGRHLAGDKSLFSSVNEQIRNTRLWLPDKFFNAKVIEQQKRHALYEDTAYSLEPNIKSSPGGLRDLQTIQWVYNRHYGITSFKELHQQGHISNDEYRILIRARNILWKIRIGLHLSTGRREDRLLFDSQRQLAADFGYQDTATHLAVEQLMKRFYRTAQQVIYLNEVLLSHYRVSNSSRFAIAVSRNIDADFLLRNKMIEQRSDDLFSKKPHAMLKLFALMQEHKITAIHPDTTRAIRTHLHLVNNNFRADPKCQKLFLGLFEHQGTGLANALVRMNAYGLLGAYLPLFGAVVGQMQHDLFHVYTVDGHTLMVIQYLIRLREHPEEYELASDLLSNLYKPERLFIAALFHDIAKGRGGDHSILGESDAYQFAKQHGLSEYDSKLVGWLVLNHLRMSHFSQRRDISDPDVIKEFADIAGDAEHLDTLYLLTHADIRGTSPKVWNAWKGQLLLELYQSTRTALRHGIAQPIDEQEHVDDDKRNALERVKNQLPSREFNQAHIEQFWNTLPNEYFIRNEPYYIAWHAASLSSSKAIEVPVVSVRYSERLEANMFFVFAPDSNNLLTRVTASFDTLALNIIEARLQQNNNGFALYSFTALVPEPDSAKSKPYIEFLQTHIRELLLARPADQVDPTVDRKRASRALKHFPIQAKVKFSFNNPNHTAIEVIAQDQPGLLHNVALGLQQYNLKLLSAKVATFGARAEDIFFVQRHDRTAITDPQVLDSLSKFICSALDRTEKP